MIKNNYIIYKMGDYITFIGIYLLIKSYSKALCVIGF
jgi:hypothetical protein